MNFIARWLATALAAGVAAWILPGIAICGGSEFAALASFGLIMALVDMSIKPILQLFSLPITVLTFGLFALIINTIAVYIAAGLAAGLFGSSIAIGGFGAALWASIIISIASSIFFKMFAKDDGNR